MKSLLLIFTFILSILFAWGGDVTVSQALNVAKTQFASAKKVPLAGIQTSLVGQKNYKDASGISHTAYYVLSINQSQGFVIVSGDDKTIPVLGYVDKGTYNQQDLPNGLKKLMFAYAKEVRNIAQDQSIKATTEIRAQWNDLKNGVVSTSKSSSVSPLMTTEWGQSSGGYNTFCPTGTPAGCVATATSQIMKYHNHPAQGTGSHSYNHTDFGTLSANFGATIYDWAIMPNSLSSSSSQAEKEAIARLMYHVGVSLDMNYSPGSSGAFSRLVPDALKDYFSYDSGAEFIKRSSYSLTSWKNKIKTELDAARVVYHSGFCANPAAGHAFVMDGYNTDDKFHLNWGWGGYADGYFEVNNLNPGSTYTFNDTQSAIIKIKPLTNTTDVRMFGNISISTTTIPFNAPFSVTADIANYGNLTYNGSVKASLFDLNGVFITNVELKTSIVIPSNDYASLTFSSTGLNVPPGSYNLGIYVQNMSNNTWMLAAPDGFTNPLPVTINGSNPQGLLSNGNILVNPDPIEKDETFQVEFEILNNNTTDFNGEISIDLHELDGSWITEVESGTYSILANASENIVINHLGLSNDPGSYKMIIWHKPNGGSWEIIADGSYPNSVAVDIVGLNFSSDVPDIYENNNTEAAAYQVPTTWTQDEFIFMSSTSNIHSVTADSNDYYKLELEAGYDYKVFVRVHDNYSSMTGMYTNDVVFSVHDGTSWSNFYDDGEMDSISIPSVLTNQDLLINVVPFFYNDLGSYDLEVYVKRIGAVSVSEHKEFDFNFYPNPVSDILTIDFSTNNIKEISITTVQGQLIDKVANIQGSSYQLDLSTVAEGVYFVNLFDGLKVVTERITVVK
jgi:hypothetical protein